MAKQRIPVGPLAPPPALTPRATPVDTFHRADTKLLNQGPSEMAQMAEALGQFDPALQAIAVNAKNRENVVKDDEGQQQILRDKHLQTVKALGDAVRNGEIPAAANPAFLNGMRKQVYRIEAERYDAGLRDDYAKSNSRNTEDITSFMAGHTQKYLEDLGADPQDPGLRNILLPAIERSQANLAANHRAERDQAIELQVEQNTDTEIGLLLDHMDAGGGDPAQFAQAIHAVVQEHYQNGLSGTKGNLIMAKAIARKAKERKDSGYLDLLDMIPGGGGGTLGQIGSVKDIRREAEEYVYSKLEQDDRVNAAVAKQAKEQATTAGLSQGFGALIDDPSADITEIVRNLNAVNPEAAEKLTSWQQARINAADNVVEDPSVVVPLTAKVLGGDGKLEDIMAAHAHGDIKLTTAKELAGKIESSKDFRSPLRDPTVADLHKRLGLVISKSNEGGTEADNINAGRAQNAFLEAMLKYHKAHPDADDLDTLKYARGVQKELTDTYANEAALGAGETVKITPENIRLAAPESVDWTRQPIYTMQELSAMHQEYSQMRGGAGQLVEVASHLEVDPAEFYTNQVRLAAAAEKAAGAEKAKPKK